MTQKVILLIMGYLVNTIQFYFLVYWYLSLFTNSVTGMIKQVVLNRRAFHPLVYVRLVSKTFNMDVFWLYFFYPLIKYIFHEETIILFYLPIVPM